MSERLTFSGFPNGVVEFKRFYQKKLMKSLALAVSFYWHWEDIAASAGQPTTTNRRLAGLLICCFHWRGRRRPLFRNSPLLNPNDALLNVLKLSFVANSL